MLIMKIACLPQHPIYPARAAEQGYTLIELIVVILVLSILSYTAWSKMTETDARARATSLMAFKANVSATANMARSMCLTDHSCDTSLANGGSSVDISGQIIHMHFSYPVGWRNASSNGEGSLHQLLDTGRFRIQPELSNLTHAVYFLETARRPSQCRLIYQLSDTNFTPVMTISTDNSGC